MGRILVVTMTVRMPPIIAVARGLQSVHAPGRHERSVDGYYLLLHRDSTGQCRLIMAHRERSLSYDEVDAIVQAAGGPAGSEPCRTICYLTAQDNTSKQIHGQLVGWCEVPPTS